MIDFYLEMWTGDGFNKFFAVLFTLLALMLVGLVVGGIHTAGDHITATTQRHVVTIIKTAYQPATSGIGVGPTVTGSGGGATVLATSTSPEYELIVEFDSGQRLIVDTDKRSLLSVNEGERRELVFTYGGWSKAILHCSLP